MEMFLAFIVIVAERSFKMICRFISRLAGAALFVGALSTAAVAKPMNYVGSWVNTNSYGVGSVVTYNGGLYYALKGNRKSPNKNLVPSTSPTWWALVGTVGNTILSGVVNPTSPSLGQVGDFYINTATNTLFGPKTATSPYWPATGVSLVGSAGSAGATGAQGPAGPAGPQGVAGPAGPQGVAGPAGPAGTNGTNGANGADGSTGAPGFFAGQANLATVAGAPYGGVAYTGTGSIFAQGGTTVAIPVPQPLVIGRIICFTTVNSPVSIYLNINGVDISQPCQTVAGVAGASSVLNTSVNPGELVSVQIASGSNVSGVVSWSLQIQQ